VASRISKNGSLSLFYQHLREIAAPYRNRVDESLREIKCSGQLLQNCIDHILHSDAKRFRATLVYLAFELFSNDDWHEATPAAVAYELAHTASLIHDDICDEADKRRGKSAVHTKFGCAAAITAGDHLVFEAFNQALQSNWSDQVKLNVHRALVESSLKVSQGQSLDIESTHQWETWSLEGYLRMAELKTGALIEAPLVAGGTIAGAGELHLKALARIGSCMGIAFQMVDDANDLLAAEADSLKSLHTDFLQGKCTVVTTLLWENCPDEKREQLIRFTNSRSELNDKVEMILDLCEQYDILAKVGSVCRELVANIEGDLQSLPESKARSQLLSIQQRFNEWCFCVES